MKFITVPIIEGMNSNLGDAHETEVLIRPDFILSITSTVPGYCLVVYREGIRYDVKLSLDELLTLCNPT